MVAPPTIETALAIVVSIGVIIGMAAKTVPAVYRFLTMPRKLKEIEEQQSEIQDRMDEQHEILDNHVTDLENHVSEAQAGVLAIAYTIEENGRYGIDVDQMDAEFMRGNSRARDYLQDRDEETEQENV